MVPVHLDVLFLEEEDQVKAPLLNFQNLPWGTTNTDTPYLSETISSDPFDSDTSATVSLKPGNHLHWALPDALTKSMSIPLVRKGSFINIFGAAKGASIWSALTNKQWIKAHPQDAGSDSAFVTSKEKRQVLNAHDTELINNLAPIEKLLNSRYFPPAPNRWLITSRQGDSIQSQFILESDAKAASPAVTSAAFPIHTEQASDQPYTFPGKLTGIDSWSEPDPNGTSDDHLNEPLTAVGYGEPAFAAFYPNSNSILGYQDSNGEKDTAYEIIGWYSRADLDYYKVLKDFFLQQWKEQYSKTEASFKDANDRMHYKFLDVMQSLHEYLQWPIEIEVPKASLFSIPGTKGAVYPNAWECLQANDWIDASGNLQPKGFNPKSILPVAYRSQKDAIYSALNNAISGELPDKSVFFAEFGINNTLPTPAGNNIQVAIGNTAPEAVSALLGSMLGGATTARDIIEDHLEAIQLSSRLSSRKLDIGPKFEEFRHEKAFTAEPGGTLWSVHTRSGSNNKASNTNPAAEVTLPEDLGDLLNELNVLQQAYDKATFKIESLRERIYSDWYGFQRHSHQGKPINNPIFRDSGSGSGYSSGDGYGNGNQDPGGI